MKASQKQRLFIALPLTSGVRGNLEKVQESLRGELAGFRWLRAESLHMTLRFIGEVGLEDVYDVCRLAEEAIAELEPFGFELRGLGAFPDARRAKVLWVGAGGELDPLHTIATRLENAARELGLRPEAKPFRPHVTIARSVAGRGGGKSTAQSRLTELIEQWESREHAKVFVREVVTYRSNLRSSEGPQYEVLATAKLGG